MHSSALGPISGDHIKVSGFGCLPELVSESEVVTDKEGGADVVDDYLQELAARSVVLRFRRKTEWMNLAIPMRLPVRRYQGEGVVSNIVFPSRGYRSDNPHSMISCRF
jgi:hypothetical protein